MHCFMRNHHWGPNVTFFLYSMTQQQINDVYDWLRDYTIPIAIGIYGQPMHCDYDATCVVLSNVSHGFMSVSFPKIFLSLATLFALTFKGE